MGRIKAFVDWHPHPPFYYGWLLLGTAALGAFIATGVAQTVLGGVQDLIALDMGWDRTTIAFAATAGTWISGLTMPIIGRLADRYGPRYMMVIAALIVGFGYLALSGVNSLWQFFVVYILLRSVAGPNLQNVVPRTVAVNFFRRRRNLALGITAQNRIITESINIQIITLVSNSLDWRMAYRMLGFIALPLAIPLFIVMRKRPEDIGLLPDGDKAPPLENASIGSGVKASTGERDFDWRMREALVLPTFWFIVWAEFLAVTTTGAIGFQIVPFLSDAGMSNTVAASALSVSIFLGGLSVPLWGYISDRSSVKRLALTALSLILIPTVILLLIDPLEFGYPVVIVWGILAGGMNVVGSMMLGNYFGRTSFGTLNGLTGPFRTAAMGLGPSLGALLFNLTHGYQAIFVTAIVCYVVAIALTFSVKHAKLPARAFPPVST
ncbi:MAG: MFS transporter [Chloroflexi bacterium]|nr:MFS transporter [Chloroflexota bacterium]MDA1226683.1 MFS transporter [Chloroflexota bacterium]